MISILSGLAGAACCLGVWQGVEKSRGGMVALFGAVAILFFVVSLMGSGRNSPISGCFIDWDGRSNSEVCD